MTKYIHRLNAFKPTVTWDVTENGHPQAMFKLATWYQYGLDMELDLNKAKSWLGESANAGNRDAARELAKLQ